MRERNRYKSGDNFVICDYSGFKIHSSEARKTWDGNLVKAEFWESRHPQDFVRSKADKEIVRESRPESSDSFLETNDVTRDSL